MQADSGIKDKIAQHWINILITKSRELQDIQLRNRTTRDPRLNDSKFKGPPRQAFVAEIKKRIEDELFQWLITQPSHTYDSLPSHSRKSLAFMLFLVTLIQITLY